MRIVKNTNSASSFFSVIVHPAVVAQIGVALDWQHFALFIV